MTHSVELLRNGEPLALRYNRGGYYLAFSGGKDSQALIHMAQLAGVKFDSHFSPMSADSPEVLRFIRRNYPEVEFVPLTTSIYKEFVKRKCLPSMKIRWCCAEFKEKGGEGRVTLVGVRNSESIKRSKRKEVEVTGRKFSGDLDGFNEWREKRIEKIKKKAAKDNQFDQFSEHQEQMVTCVGGKDKIVVSPIIHWTDKDVWEFLNKVVEVPHCELYDQGWTRIGCICCPMANIKSTLRDIERWPHVKEKWIQAIMEVRRQGMVDIEYADAQEITPPLHDAGQFTNCRSTATRFLNPTCLPRQVDYISKSGGQNQSPERPQTPQRNMGGFSVGVNAEGEDVNAEYKLTDEQIERKVAEAIFDWWISKKSYRKWYADKYLQQELNFGE